MGLRTDALGKLLPVLGLTAALIMWPGCARAEVGAIRNIPAANLQITEFAMFQERYGLTGECVFFKNTAPITAKRVVFLYSILGEDGKPQFGETHEAKGNFTTGALIRGRTPVNCQDGLISVGDGQVAHDGKGGSLVASVAEVDYVDGTSWHAGPDIIGAALKQPESDVHITKAFSWEPGGSTQECVDFTNAGSRTVRHVQFMFSHIADDGSDVVDDPLDVRWEYQPGASQTLSCRGWNGSATPRVGAAPDSAPPELLAFGKAARLVAWVSEIEYTDGTSWHAPAQQSNAVAAAAVPNTVDYSHAVWWPQPPDIPEKFSQQSASGVAITKAFVWNAGVPNECVDFVSDSAKPVKHIRFEFDHLDANGSLLAEEPLDIRARGGAYPADKPQEMNCRTFEGTVILPVLWNGGGSDPQVLFNDEPSTVQVHIDDVEYADGTSWTPAGGK